MASVVNERAVLRPDVYRRNGAAINVSKYGAATLARMIKSIFAYGEQGFAYDPNDLSTLYQDAAGTIPVTAVGQPVGLMLDKSGRNNHAFQTVSASRPILQRNATTGAYYLAFDGFDDSLETNNVDFTATDKVSIFAGIKAYYSDAGMLCELSNDANSAIGSFFITAPEYRGDLGTGYFSTATGSNLELTGSKSAYVLQSIYPDTAVLSVQHDISNSLSTMRRDGVKGIDGTYDKGTGNFGNHPLYIGRRGGTTLPFNGHLYSLIGIGRLTSDSETIALEKAIAKNVGVTLNA